MLAKLLIYNAMFFKVSRRNTLGPSNVEVLLFILFCSVTTSYQDDSRKFRYSPPFFISRTMEWDCSNPSSSLCPILFYLTADDGCTSKHSLTLPFHPSLKLHIKFGLLNIVNKLSTPEMGSLSKYL